jgi:D-3-phosphoglycerate dehydrogenase
MIIAIPDDYQQLVTTLDCYARLAGHDVRVFQGPAQSIDELAGQLKDAEVIVPIRERTHFSRELIARLPRLRHIGQTGRSTHHIDVGACTARGIAISAGTQASPYTVAEHAWALILAALRDIPGQVRQMKRGAWSSHMSLGLHGRTLGIYGFGKIGSLVARTGLSFGMRVLAWGGEASRRRATEAGCDFAASKRQLFAESDVLSLQLRLSDRTRHAIGADDFALMKPTSLFVNTARAELVSPGTLEAALKLGRPGHAAVDVYENEPVLGGEHPLLKMSQALCTPHSAWIEKDTFELYFGEAFDNVVKFARGETVNLVNPEVLATISKTSRNRR